MDKLKQMKDTLVSCIQTQMTHLDSVDTKELGEVVDMVKDLEEAIYYCTITKAMTEKEEKEPRRYFVEPMYPYYYPYPYDRDIDRDKGRMYYSDSSSNGQGRSSGSNGRSGNGGNGSRYYDEDPRYHGGEREYPITLPIDMRDIREGRSPKSRKMYMESKEMHKDKAKQMKDLEKYMQELSFDILEMIEESSPEERQLLSSKISTLATKINTTK